MSTTINLKSPITEIKGFGPKKAEAFSRLGLFKLEDLLRYYPREYEDLRNKKTINNLIDSEKAVVIGTVVLNVLGRGYGRKRTLHLSVVDKTGKMEVLFFMAGFMSKNFKIGQSYRFFGKVKVEEGKVTMFHPSYQLYDNDDESSDAILPIYPLTKGLTQKDLRKAASSAISLLDEYEETLPGAIIKKANLCPIDFAIKHVHYPEDGDKYSQARYRLVFEELFDLKIALKLSSDRFGSGRDGISFSKGSYNKFIDSLDYELTNAQKKVLEEINTDMDSTRAMNRLVQGDVGSGKTVVAQAAMYKAVSAGYQAAFMAPTEILAMQHYNSFQNMGLNVACIASSISSKERSMIIEKLLNGEIDILVGTHAVISDGIEFKNLGLVITDEQHRFGVNQRRKLSEKANNPDVLVMTATPIPRTLAVVLYSDLDISVIDELPAGRKEIITNKFNSETRALAYEKLLSEVKKGKQAYIVAPFIEDSESISGYSAESLYEEFSKKYKNIKAALLHGEMKQDEKDHIMQDFYNNKYSVLISTVVIEVGINVPNATVMLIENAERFGLAQLHQLRGRVGRGNDQSYCMLVLGEESEIAKKRSDVLCNSSDGFYISEEDLKMRGPGEIFGNRQHGLAQLQLADPIKHENILKEASKLALECYNDDPLLEKTDNLGLKRIINLSYGGEKGLVL